MIGENITAYVSSSHFWEAEKGHSPHFTEKVVTHREIKWRTPVPVEEK